MLREIMKWGKWWIENDYYSHEVINRKYFKGNPDVLSKYDVVPSRFQKKMHNTDLKITWMKIMLIIRLINTKNRFLHKQPFSEIR